MVTEENVLVFDVDGTLCEKKRENEEYNDIQPIKAMVEKLKYYEQQGHYIILYTSRQMRTYKGNLGKINANTAKTLFDWLEKHSIPYDEIHFGKPWCGHNGVYIDDRAIRPREFIEYTTEQIEEILKRDRV